jgi:CRISPR/Cas system-associated protein Csx1
LEDGHLKEMNASAAFVKYLIKSDGTVIIPNTSPNSLTENKGTFESGENVLIQYSGTGNQQLH